MSAATQRATDWLSSFETLTNAGEIDKALAHFDDAECFWRDLVFFSWNLKTTEGKVEIGNMLKATLPHAGKVTWRIDGEATGDEALTEAWLLFENEVARGKGYLKLRNGKAWVLMTSLLELKGHEEHKGPRRDKGVVHGAFHDRTTWLERREKEERELGYKTQPYCLIIGGGQGGIGLGARMRRLGIPTIIIEKNKKPGTRGANVTSRSACMTRSGMTTCPICRFLMTGRSSAPKTKLVTGLKCTPK